MDGDDVDEHAAGLPGADGIADDEELEEDEEDDDDDDDDEDAADEEDPADDVGEVAAAAPFKISYSVASRDFRKPSYASLYLLTISSLQQLLLIRNKSGMIPTGVSGLPNIV